MRNRTTILVLLACVFAAVSAVGANRQATVCADRSDTEADEFLLFSIGNDGSCPVESSSPTAPLEQLFLILTAGCLGAAVISAGKVWMDRQQDRALLQGAVFWWGRQHYR